MPEECPSISCCPATDTYPIVPVTGTLEVDATVSPEESGEVDGAGEYDALDTVTLEAEPESGFAFVSWQDSNGYVLSESNPWVFTITANMSVFAIFEAE